MSLPGLLFVVPFNGSPLKINADGTRPTHHMYAVRSEGLDLRTGWMGPGEKSFHVVSSRLCGEAAVTRLDAEIPMPV